MSEVTNIGDLYIFPCGIFETQDYRGEWHIYQYRPMPCTPAGDLISSHSTKEEAEQELARLETVRKRRE